MGKIMGRALSIFSKGFVALLLIASLLIAIFDSQSSPPSKPSSWHAYLTEDELQHPLAKYWFDRAEPDSGVLEALNAGPLREDEVLSWDDRHKLVKAGYLSGENGWARFGDGSAYVAVKTFFPGATAEMIDWWFEWAQREEDIRYKIWYPGAHYAMSQAPTPNAANYEKPKAYWGKSRFPVEDVGVGVARLRLDFVPPSEFGFDELPEGSTMLAVRVGLPNGLLKTTDMIHFVRPVEGGVEMRSRFWIAREFEAMAGGLGVAAALADNALVKQVVVPENLPQELALHCANEYSQLASFLPEVFAEYGPKG
jgi:hypothetical protein